MIKGVDAKGFEEGHNNEDGRPTVVEREGKVNEDYIHDRISIAKQNECRYEHARSSNKFSLW